MVRQDVRTGFDPEIMRTLLRRITTGRYFQGPGQWTDDPAQALDFRMIDMALDFVQRWRLEDVEVAFAFSDRRVRRVPIEKVALRFGDD